MMALRGVKVVPTRGELRVRRLRRRLRMNVGRVVRMNRSRSRVGSGESRRLHVVRRATGHLAGHAAKVLMALHGLAVNLWRGIRRAPVTQATLHARAGQL